MPTHADLMLEQHQPPLPQLPPRATEAGARLTTSSPLGHCFLSYFQADFRRALQGIVDVNIVIEFLSVMMYVSQLRSNSREDYDEEIASMIVSNRIPECLKILDARITEKLKRLIYHCWSFEKDRRPQMSQILPHFTAGSVLLRRHSTSEPKLN